MTDKLASRFAALLAPVLVFIQPGTTFANGDIFFHLDVFNLSDTPIEEQVVYIGNVKDVDGKYIVDAIITVGVMIVTSHGDRLITYNAYTNVLGRYRTLDVSSVILALEEKEYDFDRKQINVTVEKEGYKVVQRLDRSRRSQTGGMFEINFVMAPEGQTNR